METKDIYVNNFDGSEVEIELVKKIGNGTQVHYIEDGCVYRVAKSLFLKGFSLKVIASEADLIRLDTLSLLVCAQSHKGLSLKQRAMKLAKCCKIVRDRTQDSSMYNACRSIIKGVSRGDYTLVIAALNQTEWNYYKEYA